MYVLIACEESQRVCMAFRECGHNAFSCDIQVPSGGHPEWHIFGDALKAIQGGQIVTMDGVTHDIPKWDLLIAHPPCTYLSKAGACRLYPCKGELNQERYEKGLEAKAFFLRFFNANCARIAVENPVPLKVFGLPEYSQKVQPYEFGHSYSKSTCLWLKGLPLLQPTKVLPNFKPFLPSSTSRNAGTDYNKGTVHSKKERSKTFEGIAQAMADQWGCMPEYEVQLTLTGEIDRNKP